MENKYLRLDLKLLVTSISDNRTAIMGLSMLSIMLFHQYFTSVIPFNFFHNYGYWGVDVFVFLSGMGIVNSLGQNSKKVFYRRRFIRIVPSCILCGVIRFFLIIFLGSFSVVLHDKLNYSVWTLASLDLWFIHTILILYIISPFLYYCLNRWPISTLFSILFLFFMNGLFVKPLVGFDWLSPIGVMSWTVERLLVFSVGMYISINKEKLHINIVFSLVCLLFAVCLVFIEKVGYTFKGLQTCMYFSLAVGMPMLIYILLGVLNQIPNILKCPLLFMGSYSLEIYLTHEFILWVLKVAFGNGNPWILLPLGLSLSFLSAFLCKICTSRWKLINVH